MTGTPENVPDLTEIVARFDGRAPEYDTSAMHRGLAAAVAKFANLDGVSAALDVATGTGLVLRSFPTGQRRRLVGIDVSEGMLDVARKALPDAQFVRGDAHALAFGDGEFDLVTCVTALHLFAEPVAALREWRRVLRPGGKVVVATFRADHAGGGHSPSAHGPVTDRHYAFGSIEALADFAGSAGMRLTRHTTWTHPDPLDQCLIAEFAIESPGRARERDA